MTEEESSVHDLKSNLLNALWMVSKMCLKSFLKCVLIQLPSSCNAPVLRICPDLQCSAATTRESKKYKHACTVCVRFPSPYFTQTHASRVHPCLRDKPRCPLLSPARHTATTTSLNSAPPTFCSDKFHSRTRCAADMPNILKLHFSQLFQMEWFVI